MKTAVVSGDQLPDRAGGDAYPFTALYWDFMAPY